MSYPAMLELIKKHLGEEIIQRLIKKDRNKTYTLCNAIIYNLEVR